MGIEGIGALCFGVVIGWVTHRTLRRTKKAAGYEDITAVIGAVGGAAVTALFKVGALFGAYCIGLFVGFFVYFIIAMVYKPKDVDPGDYGLLGADRVEPK